MTRSAASANSPSAAARHEARHAGSRARAQSPDQAAALHSEHRHGAHETAWWFAASAIKLGLLGTVVGFIFMASRIGPMPSFDVDQIQALLTQMLDPFSDLLFNTLLAFVLLFAAALVAMSPKARTGVIDAKAEFIITVTWPDLDPNHIDTWVQDAGGNLVWFRAREAGPMHSAATTAAWPMTRSSSTARRS